MEKIDDLFNVAGMKTLDVDDTDDKARTNRGVRDDFSASIEPRSEVNLKHLNSMLGANITQEEYYPDI